MGKQKASPWLCCYFMAFAIVGALITAIVLELQGAGRDFAIWLWTPQAPLGLLVESSTKLWRAQHRIATARSFPVGGGQAASSAASSSTVLRTQHGEAASRSLQVVEGELVSAAPKPFYNFLYLIFTGDTPASLRRREELRRIYGDYNGVATATDGAGAQHPYTFRVLFIARKPGAPPDGELAGDLLYLDVEDGYYHIAAKTLGMMGVVTHFNFDYVMKGDEDTYVCFNLLASILHAVPAEVRGRVYAGVPTACNIAPRKPIAGRVIRVKRHRWYDEPFIRHTLNGLDCYPVYMQGAFYVLAKPLVDLLHRSRDHLVVFGNEDATIGSWLLGTNRELLPLGRVDSEQVWRCPCSHGMEWRPETANMTFYHNCKHMDQLRKCSLSRDSGHERALC
ncbi:unnamed protein product [Phaeothamnion confervicola]